MTVETEILAKLEKIGNDFRVQVRQDRTTLSEMHPGDAIGYADYVDHDVEGCNNLAVLRAILGYLKTENPTIYDAAIRALKSE